MSNDEIAANIQTLKNPDAKPEEYSQALHALANGSAEVVAAVLREAVEPNTNTSYQLYLAMLLPTFGKKVIKPLATELLNPNPKVRLNAARHLQQTGYEEVIPILEQYLLVEEDSFVQKAVRWYMSFPEKTETKLE